MKIIVTGPFQCGKSSLIKAFDKKSLNIMTIDKNHKCCTIGMDIGSLYRDGIKISLFGTPGLLRFSTMRKIICEGADGVIFMFDGINPAMDDSAIQILNEIRENISKNVPIVYVVNKMDDLKCRSAEVVREQNYLPKSAEIFGISAKTQENIEAPLNELIMMMKEYYTPIVRILENFKTNPLGLKIPLEMSAKEIMDLLNFMELRGIISVDRKNMEYTMGETAKFFI